MLMERPDSRKIDELRAISFVPNIAPNATGSVLVSFGQTRVICSVMVQSGVPRWMKEQKVEGGWLTAEYSMLPYSTGGGRKARSSAPSAGGTGTAGSAAAGEPHSAFAAGVWTERTDF